MTRAELKKFVKRAKKRLRKQGRTAEAASIKLHRRRRLICKCKTWIEQHCPNCKATWKFCPTHGADTNTCPVCSPPRVQTSTSNLDHYRPFKGLVLNRERQAFIDSQPAPQPIPPREKKNPPEQEWKRLSREAKRARRSLRKVLKEIRELRPH